MAVSRTTPHLLKENHILQTQCGKDKGSIPTTVISYRLITGINCERVETLTAHLPVLGSVAPQHPNRR